MGIVLAEDVVSIEEHWELRVGGPDASRSAPQVTMVMSPTGDLYCDHFIVTLNHSVFPDFLPGGIQIQRWSNDECEETVENCDAEPFAINDEVITWVQRMTIDGCQLTFEVVNGESESWGDFGGEGELKFSYYTWLSRLNSYKPSVSIGESGIGYAGNRVSSLTLTKLRWTTADGEVHEMVAPIDIHADLDP